MAIPESGYPKKDEIIHASDVGETFAGVTISRSVFDSWTLYTASLTRRNDGSVPAIGYVTGSLDESTPEASFITVGTAKSSLQKLANEHHTHTTSDFTELGGWSITESSDKSLVFSVG